VKSPGDAVAEWIAKAIVAIALFVLVVALAAGLFVFSAIVRTAAHAMVADGATDPFGEVNPWRLRLIGSGIGAVLALVCWLGLLVLVPLPAFTALVALSGGIVLGAVVAIEGDDPWRPRPAGTIVDDWRDLYG
jgi:hypothetical protein